MTGASSGSGGPVPRDVHVDVGLTAYQRATYIAEAIESVLAQTYDRWRLTICDNGPGGGEIAEAVRPYLDDPRMSYLPTGRELSLAENWTNALNQGSGTYVAVLSDDDRWHRDYLSGRVEALEAHPECGFAFSEWVQIDEHGTVTKHAPIRFPEGVLSRELLARIFTRQNPVVPPAILLRRSACEAVGAFFDDAWQYCDWELWGRMAARFPVYYLARRDNDFRRHSTAYTFAERETPEQLLAMVDHLEKLFVREVEGFELGRVERARSRSRILLGVAGDVHPARGWKVSGAFYGRALRSYPPTIFARMSLVMLARTVLGKRGSRVVSRLRRALRRNGTFLNRQHEHP